MEDRAKFLHGFQHRHNIAVFFPQGRVTEHRIKLTLYKIDSVMDGDLDELIDSLIAADQAAKLAKLNEEI